jgi:hypothetical protein
MFSEFILTLLEAQQADDATLLAEGAALLAEQRAREARAEEILAVINESGVVKALENRIVLLEDVICGFILACLTAVYVALVFH